MSTPAPHRGPARVDPRVVRSRAAVIGATLELLAEKGIAATTIDAVAERSGVARTTIYRQWDGQPALVMDAIGSTLDEPPVPDTGTLRGDLVALLGGLASALHESPAAALMPALIEAAERDPAFAELHRAEAAHRHRVVRHVLTRGIERGELADDADVDDLVDLLTGPLFYRRWVSIGAVDRPFATRVVDSVLAACDSRAPQDVRDQTHATQGDGGAPRPRATTRTAADRPAASMPPT